MKAPKPGNSFIWNALSDWKSVVLAEFPDPIREELIQSCQDRKTDFKYVDDESIARGFCSQFMDYEAVLSRIVRAMRSRYHNIRMFHCCRPVSVDSYYRDGIKILDLDYANQLFTSIVKTAPSFLSVTQAHYQYAFSEMAVAPGRNGQVYFGLDDRFLIKYCPDYLRYGSEYLQSLAVRIDDKANTNIKEHLRSVGKPTVFAVNISTSDITSNDMNSLVSEMLTTCLYNCAHDNDVADEIDFGISLTSSLPSERIVKHFHPEID